MYKNHVYGAQHSHYFVAECTWLRPKWEEGLTWVIRQCMDARSASLELSKLPCGSLTSIMFVFQEPINNAMCHYNVLLLKKTKSIPTHDE